MTDNTRCPSRQNIFSLIRLKPDCRIAPTFVDFSPPFIASASNGSIVPVFNDDRCHFTQAFLLSSEKKTQAQCKQSLKMQFEHRISRTISSITPEKISEMTPPSNYCQICKQFFKNYDEHVEQKNHLIRLHHNEFNEDIHQLCSLVDATESSPSPHSKRKTIKKRDHELNSIKSAPKTVDKYPKRKMSLSSQQGSFSGSQLKHSVKN